jgi:hypothetical protein
MQLEFDGSVALVDDVEVGEGVYVHLAPEGTGFRVTKIWPDDPHVPDPGLENLISELDAQTQARLAGVLASMSVYNDYRIDSLVAGDLLVHADDVLFEYGPSAILRFTGIEYVDLPSSWDQSTLDLRDQAHSGANQVPSRAAR